MMSPTVDSTAPLQKVDSLVDSPVSPSGAKTAGRQRRRSSALSAANLDVHNINDLEKENAKLVIPIETQRLNWKINTPSSTVEDKEYLVLPLCEPQVKKIDLYFQHGLHVVARNIRGVTIKDALDAIYKANKKKTAEELDGNEYLRGFEWDPSECYTRFIVHTMREPVKTNDGSKKTKGKKKEKAST